MNVATGDSSRWTWHDRRRVRLGASIVIAVALCSPPPSIAAPDHLAAFHDAEMTCERMESVNRNRMARPPGYDPVNEKARLQARLRRQAAPFRSPAGVRFLRRNAQADDTGIRHCARRLLAIVAPSRGVD